MHNNYLAKNYTKEIDYKMEKRNELEEPSMQMNRTRTIKRFVSIPVSLDDCKLARKQTISFLLWTIRKKFGVMIFGFLLVCQDFGCKSSLCVLDSWRGAILRLALSQLDQTRKQETHSRQNVIIFAALFRPKCRPSVQKTTPNDFCLEEIKKIISKTPL